MDSSDSAAQLRRFQDFGDTNSLLEYVRLTGRDTGRYKAALQVLDSVFEPLSHGEHPRYRDLDRQHLRDYAAEVRFIAGCMAASGKADMQDSAAELLRLLDTRD